MRVVDTEGDNHLGGKNLDQAIVEEVLLPALAADSQLALTQTLADPDRRRLLAGALKRHAERAKIQLSTRESVLIERHERGSTTRRLFEPNIDPTIQSATLAIDYIRYYSINGVGKLIKH
jgi:molecular chaperone DnaK (HSP70)